ncbi:two-component system sensor histidine kinase AtoS [Roseospira marina]|uniref:histidine kinase n=1 Tax=Roseospira marina TaxID=140057 RepID=A0A5M6IB04_9PROT|nr:two-component system sensor histidine kinase AtoS [Roseospira marina]KAA5605302.1 two-component system sensor histidine kinase AtoS [Roseospira marina]MBB4314770.1 two-component system sensor histidine kinase AtoS [Roseospira marina]MBB5087759.1 two-component system sensor histidine kinase AtoS [Roseospira marina]
MRPWKVLRRFSVRSLRHRLILTSLVVVLLPILIVGGVLEHQGRQALIEEKQNKLFTLARILDFELGAGGFDALIAALPSGWDDRDAAIAYLNTRLEAVTDLVAQAEAGIGVGYYSKRLDVIVTYGPSPLYDTTIGQSIAPDHPGRQVMATGTPDIAFGSLVRGQVLNAMWPIVRNGEVHGYIWANEFTEAVERQQSVIDRAVLFSALGGLLVALLIIQATSRSLSNDVGVIVNGLQHLKRDLRRPIPPLRDELGAIVDAINAMAKDLLDARSLTENILVSVADGIVAIDVEGRVTAFNPAAEALYSVSADRVIGRPYHELFVDGTDMNSVLLDTLETGRTHIGVTLRMPHSDPSLKITASSSVLRDGDGHRIGAVVVLKDVSERDRLMVQVMQADRLAALGELTAGIAHEIRNPLTSIRGFMQYLAESKSTQDWQEYGPLIIRQVDSLNHIISELLAFGRPRPPRIGRVRLNQIAKEMVFLAQGRSEARIELDLADDMPEIDADGEALKQALLNLIINALQAIDAEGSVTITTRRQGADRVTITVRDDGVGLSPQNLEKVFDPFFSTKPEGTGLGLAMVHRIIASHDGSIRLDSTEGKGTVVTIVLPITAPNAQEKPE